MRQLSVPMLFGLLVLQAQPAGNFALTIDNIMRGPGLVGYEPAAVRWSHDSERLYFQWKQSADNPAAPMDTYVVNRDGSGLRKLTDEEIRQLPPAVGDTSKDARLTTYANSGDLFVYDNATGKTRQLTKTTDIEANPHFTQDGKRIYFTRSNNLYVMLLDTAALVQVTDIRSAGSPTTAAPPGGMGRGGRGLGQGGLLGQGLGGRGGVMAPPAAPPTTGDQPPRGSDSQEYLKKEQKELLEAIRNRAALREEQDKKRQQDNPRKPFTLQARQSINSLQLSPDEKFVIAAVFEAAAAPAKNTIIPNYITESAYTEDIPGRSNAGDNQGIARLAIINTDTGEVKWVDHGQKKLAPAGGATQRTESGKEVGAATPPRQPASDERDVQLGMPVWSQDGGKAVISARSADNKDRWILALDPATGKTRVLINMHDNAWVGGPQGAANILGWMKNDREVFFQSEKTGFSHLYAVSFEGGEPRALTSGNWEVLDARQSKDKSKFYLTASADGPFDQHIYEMDGNGGPHTRITKLPGKHIATLSPDERWIADVYSYTNQPPDLYVLENKPQAHEAGRDATRRDAAAPSSASQTASQTARRLTTSPSPEFSRYAWLDVPIVKFTARDGVAVPAHLFKPANFNKGGPAVVFVHGAGYLQNVDHKWSTYYHEYLFHHILMERGFLVIDVDYRGSAGYGRDWRAAIYEHMGGKDLDDIVDAARYIAAQHGVDPRKIGIYGGSYGGFITLMAMFTQPGVFAAGAALRPVSDWALYNHGYTSNILNTPQADAEAYRKSSPIFFAEGLQGALLICHGMVDTNVEFQDTVRLVERLIELRKENWSLAVYPVEDHGFVQPASWADEYKRILALFEKNLK